MNIFNVLPRATSPSPGQSFSNGAVVVLCKVLPYAPDGELSPCCIVLCRWRDMGAGAEYVTWKYDESAAGCTGGHYHGAFEAAAKDWLERT